MAHKGNIKGTRKDLLLQRRWIVPTLQSAPTTSTWAWNDNGITVYFRIGEQVRVEDAEQSSGYQFWKLYDIRANGDRIWAPINSCAVAVHTFHFLETSYNSAKSAKGALIQITCDNDERDLSFTWNGQDVSYVLKPNSTYMVTVGTVQYYTQRPASFTIITGNSDSGTITHIIRYTHQREGVYVRLSKMNDSDISAVNVSIQQKSGATNSANISTTGSSYTLLGYVLYSYQYYIRVAGSTFCWSGTLFGAYETTLREASSSTYFISLPFTDDRIDVVFKHTTSNGEVFFDPEDVVGYENKNIQIIFIATSGSTYEGDEIKENLCPHGYGSPYLSRITAISSDPRNTASLQYNVSKYLLPGNYVIKCATDFAVTTNAYYNMGSYTKIQNQFYQLQSPITKEVTENDNVIEFTWKLIYCYLKARSRDYQAATVSIRRTDSGATFDKTVSISQLDGIGVIGMVSVPGTYRLSFADIPYTYRGISTKRTCKDTYITLDPATTSKRYTVTGNPYYYPRTYECNVSFVLALGNQFIVSVAWDEFDKEGYGTSCKVNGNGEFGQYKFRNPDVLYWPNNEEFIALDVSYVLTSSYGTYNMSKTLYISWEDTNGQFDSSNNVYSRVASKPFTIEYDTSSYSKCVIRSIKISNRSSVYYNVHTDEFGYEYKCYLLNKQQGVTLYENNSL